MNILKDKPKLSFLSFSLIAFILTYVIYNGLFETFYQQDEWLTLGAFFVNGWKGAIGGQSLVHLFTALGRPFVIPIHYIFFDLFPFDIWPLATFSIIMHALNTILVYMIAYRLLNSRIGAWGAGLFFLISQNGTQAVSWFATSTVTLSSVFFSLLSILFFFSYLNKQKVKCVFLSGISLIISYLYKESALMLVILLPCMYILFAQKNKYRIRDLKYFLPLLVYFIFTTVITISRLLNSSTQWGVFVGQSNGGFGKIVHNVLLYPILSFSQIFIPSQLITNIFPSLQSITLFSTILFVFLSIIMVTLLTIFTLLNIKEIKQIIFVILFIFLSFMPYAILERRATYLDSRYFYFGMAGGGLLIGVLLESICNVIASRKKIHFLLLFCIMLIVSSLYLVKNIQFIQRDINFQVQVAQERISVLKQIRERIQNLPKNPIFYVTGDITSYYLLPQQKIPFQQGIGYTLMCLYYRQGVISHELLEREGNYFWDINTQGYKEIGGNGFGYYWNKDDLLKFVKGNKNISTNQIVGIYYYSNTQHIENISSNIRDYVSANR